MTEIIKVEGWMVEYVLDAIREGATAGREDHAPWKGVLRPMRGSDFDRRVKVTVEVLAEEPTPQRGDVWEDRGGTSRFLLRSQTDDDRSLWWGVCVHATNAGRVGDHHKVAPGRLVARLDPVQGDEQ